MAVDDEVKGLMEAGAKGWVEERAAADTAATAAKRAAGAECLVVAAMGECSVAVAPTGAWEERKEGPELRRRALQCTGSRYAR